MESLDSRSLVSESPKKGEKFNLETFLQTNHIDQSNPKMVEKIKNFENSIKDRQDLTKSQLLDLLAFHGISSVYTHRAPQMVERDWKELKNSYTTDSSAIKPTIDAPQSLKPILQEVPEDLGNGMKKISLDVPENFRNTQKEAVEMQAAMTLGRKMERDFQELYTEKMSHDEVKSALQKYGFDVKNDGTESSIDLGFFDIKRKKRFLPAGDYIELFGRKVLVSEIRNVKNIEGNIFMNLKNASHNRVVDLIRKNPATSLDAFYGKMDFRKQAVLGNSFEGEKGENELKRVWMNMEIPNDAILLTDVKTGTQRLDIFRDNAWRFGFSHEPHHFVMVGDVGYSYDKNGALQHIWTIEKWKWASVQDIEKYNQMQLEMEENRQRYRSFADNSSLSEAKNMVNMPQATMVPNIQNMQNPNDFTKNGVRIQKNGNTATLTTIDGKSSQSVSGGVACTNGVCVDTKH